MHRNLLIGALWLFSWPAYADEEAQIVTTCHFANAEWGVDAIHRCIEVNKSLRDDVLRLPAEFATAVKRCRASAELGWEWVKSCVEMDTAARTSLASDYADDAKALIDSCRRDFESRGFVLVKECVDRGMKGR